MIFAMKDPFVPRQLMTLHGASGCSSTPGLGLTAARSRRDWSTTRGVSALDLLERVNGLIGPDADQRPEGIESLAFHQP